MKLLDRSEGDRDVVAPECATGSEPGVQHRFAAVTSAYGVEATYDEGTRRLRAVPAAQDLRTEISLDDATCGNVAIRVNNGFGAFANPTPRAGGGYGGDDVRRDVDRALADGRIDNPQFPRDQTDLYQIFSLAVSVGGLVSGGTLFAVLGAGLEVYDMIQGFLTEYDSIYQQDPGRVRVEQQGLLRTDATLGFNLVDFTVTVPQGERATLSVEQMINPDGPVFIETAGIEAKADSYRYEPAPPAEGAALESPPDQGGGPLENLLADDGSSPTTAEQWRVELPAIDASQSVGRVLDRSRSPNPPTVPALDDPAPPDPAIRISVRESEAGADDAADDGGTEGDESVPTGASLTHDDLDVGDSFTTGLLRDATDEPAFVAGSYDDLTFQAALSVPDTRVESVEWRVTKEGLEADANDQPLVKYIPDPPYEFAVRLWSNPLQDPGSIGDGEVPTPSDLALGPGTYTARLTVTTTEGLRRSTTARFEIEGESNNGLDASIDAPEAVNVSGGEDGEPPTVELDASGTTLPPEYQAVVYEWKLFPERARGPTPTIRRYGTEGGGDYDVAPEVYGESVRVPLDGLLNLTAEETPPDLRVVLTVWLSQRSGQGVGRVVRKVSSDDRPGTQPDAEKAGEGDPAWPPSRVIFDEAETTVELRDNAAPDPSFAVPPNPSASEPFRLDASFADDPDGDALVSYTWQVVELAPDGDLLRETDNGTTAGGGALAPTDVWNVRDRPERVAAHGEAYEYVELDLDSGPYDIQLTVTDDRELSASSTERISVRRTDELSITIDGPEQVTPGEEATFTALTTGASEVGYDWSGEALVGQERTAIFTPEGAGEYTIAVDARSPPEPSLGAGSIPIPDDNEVERDRDEVTVTVNSPPEAEVDLQDQYAPGSYQLTAAVAEPEPGDQYTFEWGGDVPTQTETVPATSATSSLPVEFSEIGDRTLELTVTDRFGASTTVERAFEVEDPSEAIDVSLVGPTTVREGDVVTFLAQVSGAHGEVVYDWNVDDAGSRARTAFVEQGTRTVEVTVDDELGYDATASREVTVIPEARPEPPDQGDGEETTSGFLLENGQVSVGLQPGADRTYIDSIGRGGVNYGGDIGYFPRDGDEAGGDAYQPQRVLSTAETGRSYTIDRRYRVDGQVLDVTAQVRLPADSRAAIVDLTYENAGDTQLTVDTPPGFIADGLPLGSLTLPDPNGSYRFHVSDDGTRRFENDLGWSVYRPAGTVPFVTAFDDRNALSLGLLNGDTGVRMGFTNNGGSTEPADAIRLHVESFSLAPGESNGYTVALGIHEGGADAPATATEVLYEARRRVSDVIDDFETSDPLSAYRNPDGANWQVSDNYVESGRHNLYLDDQGYHNLYSLPGDGLPTYPEPGEFFGGSFGVDGDNGAVLFGVESGQNGVNGYMFRASPFNNSVGLYRLDDGGKTELASTAFDVSRGTTYLINIDWTENGRIDATLFTGNFGSATVSATDTTYGRGGFGFRAGNLNGPDSPGPVQAWFDDWS